MRLPGWIDSVRAVLAVMAMILLFIVGIGSLMGAKMPNEVLQLISMVIGAIVTAYFGKRDQGEEISRGDTTVKSTVVTEVTPPIKD